jgi:hypothetical protein
VSRALQRAPGERRDETATIHRPRRFSRGAAPLVMIVIFPSKTTELDELRTWLVGR